MSENKEHGMQMRIKIFNIIVDYIKLHGYPPTIREIGDLCGLKSTSSVNSHLEQMYQEGMIETDHPGSPRAIRIPGLCIKSKQRGSTATQAKSFALPLSLKETRKILNDEQEEE